MQLIESYSSNDTERSTTLAHTRCTGSGDGNAPQRIETYAIWDLRERRRFAVPASY